MVFNESSGTTNIFHDLLATCDYNLLMSPPSPLRVVIIYYTGSGTTAHFSRYISEILEQEGVSVERLRIKRNSDLNRLQFDRFDIIAMGCPVWVWNPPRTFLKIIKKRLRNTTDSSKAFFVFNSCGGSPGNTSWELYSLLRRRMGIYLGELTATGANNIRAWRSKMDSTKQELDSITPESLQSANIFVKLLLKKLSAEPSENWAQFQAHPPKKSIFNKFLLWTSTFRWEMQVLVGKKRVNLDLCTKCGLCATKICPSGAISLTVDSTPLFAESRCTGCFGCVNACPTLAIDSTTTKNKKPLTTYRKELLKFE